jgi:hypothetical protein
VSNDVNLSARIVNLSAASSVFQRQEHAYHEPFNKGRLGDIFEDPLESYVEATLQSNQCRLLTLFMVSKSTDPAPVWQCKEDGWWINTDDLAALVRIDDDTLTVKDEASGKSWTVKIEG